MKILLVHPPADEEYGEREAKYLTAPPIGLTLLTGILSENLSGIEIKIIDGNFEKMSKIIQEIKSYDYDIVGVSSWYSKHRNALQILKEAKKINRACMTVMGGPNASHLGKQILQNNQFVDYAIKGDGEDAFLQLCKKESKGYIPNLFYRAGKNIDFTFEKKAKMNNVFDCSCVNLAKYDFLEDKPFPISLIRGCIKAVKCGRCSFCSLPAKEISLMPVELAWKQIALLKKKYGLKYFFETGDSFIPGYYQRLIKARPKNLEDVQFRIYASPDQITEISVKILKKLNVKEIFLGIESINNEILKKAGKLYSEEQIIKALTLLDKAFIRIQVPFIYGLPGETPETAMNTYQFAKKVISDFSVIYSLLVSTPVPLVGSKLFQIIKGEAENDIIDYEQLSKELINKFTDCSWEEVQMFVRETSKLINDKNRSGGMCLTK